MERGHQSVGDTELLEAALAGGYTIEFVAIGDARHHLGDFGLTVPGENKILIFQKDWGFCKNPRSIWRLLRTLLHEIYHANSDLNGTWPEEGPEVAKEEAAAKDYARGALKRIKKAMEEVADPEHKNARRAAEAQDRERRAAEAEARRREYKRPPPGPPAITPGASGGATR